MRGGDLTVFVQESSAILKYKPDAQVLYSTEERVEIIKSLRIVDEVQVYTDVDAAVKEYDFDIFAKGPDQNSIGVQNAVKWCIENNKKIIEIPRTANISSSYLKKIIDDIK